MVTILLISFISSPIWIEELDDHSIFLKWVAYSIFIELCSYWKTKTYWSIEVRFTCYIMTGKSDESRYNWKYSLNILELSFDTIEAISHIPNTWGKVIESKHCDGFCSIAPMFVEMRDGREQILSLWIECYHRITRMDLGK